MKSAGRKITNSLRGMLGGLGGAKVALEAVIGGLGMGAGLAMGRALRGPVGACSALPYRFGANLRPVQKARPASAVMTAAKIMCAVSGPRSADSKPIPITGTELPAKHAIR